MNRNTRPWKGIGPLTLGGLILSGSLALADEAPPLARQLTDLGRQALAQGNRAQANKFFKKALELSPGDHEVIRIAMQDPPAPPPVPDTSPISTPPAGPPTGATLEKSDELDNIRRQELTSDIRQRQQQARNLVFSGQPKAALEALSLAQMALRAAEGIDEATRNKLARELQVQYMATVRDEERIEAEQTEKTRLLAARDQQMRALDVAERTEDSIDAMMVQFTSLMAQGRYNVWFAGGTGDIIAANQPFYDARTVAQEARALNPQVAAPHAGLFTSQTMSFLAQEMAFEALKEYRFMLTMVDVDRAAVPHPDYKVIEYPAAARWRKITEERAKYIKAVDMVDRDPGTKNILTKLDQPITMSFPTETSLEDVLKYIKSATAGPNDSGIPIYVDPVGLQEAEKTLSSTVTLELEGIPLRKTLKLLLKQLSLSFTVKDGLLTITSESSEDQQTEIRVYPVADLALIPMSLIGGGGGGGMGGGMGGMGGGMGGMGGGGMGGGGMGGGGMGGGMGMMSVPAQDPADAPAVGGLMQKKRN